MKNKSSLIQWLALLFTCCVFTPSVSASGGLTGPTSSTTGNYTISSSNTVCSQPSNTYHLLENNITVQSGCAISKSFAGKASGSYIYTLRECEYDSEFGREFCFNRGTHTVVVSAGGSDNPIGDNDVRLGHYDNDGLIDIFVNSVVSAPYVLRQLSNRSFQLKTGLSSSQITTYSGWTLVTGILVNVSDFNADGTDDLMLVDVSS